MKASELRIGNYVGINNPNAYFHLKGLLFKVININRNENYSITVESELYEEYNQFIKFIDPILLTVDMLIVFGFRIKFVTDPQEFNPLREYTLGQFKLFKFTDDKNFFYSSGKGFHTDIKYLHQLQNLYFSLTGIELELK